MIADGGQFIRRTLGGAEHAVGHGRCAALQLHSTRREADDHLAFIVFGVTANLSITNDKSASSVLSLSNMVPGDTVTGGSHTTVTGSTASFTQSGVLGSYTVSYFATDVVGNSGSTQTVTFSIIL